MSEIRDIRLAAAGEQKIQWAKRNMPLLSGIEQDFRSTLKSCQQVTLDTMKKDKLYRKILGWLLKVFAPLM